MMNKDLFTYAQTQLDYIEIQPTAKQMFFHNVFGAFEWEFFRTGDTAVMEAWENEWRDKFFAKMREVG